MPIIRGEQIRTVRELFEVKVSDEEAKAITGVDDINQHMDRATIEFADEDVEIDETTWEITEE